MRTSTSVRRGTTARVSGAIGVAVLAGLAAGACASGRAGRSAGTGQGATGGAERVVDSLRRVVGAAQRARVDDSVQVGYGTLNRRRMTGSVASVSGDVARREHVVRVEDLLRRVSGVVVSPRSDGSFSIRVRGATTLSAYSSGDPLFVIDGVPVTDGPGALRGMTPEDIDRIDVIKDAEASVYGSRAANGVILVRTRRSSPYR